MVEWGASYEYSARMHLLWWSSVPLTDSSSLEELRSEVAGVGSGVYCIEGSHDARREPGPLYIGRTKEDFLGRLRIARGSLGHFFFTSPTGDEVLQTADSWNLVVRWAPVSEADVADVESLLIRFHKPNYNHHGLTGFDRKNLIVINAGSKGTLIPVLASQYFAPPEHWPHDP